MRQYSKIDRAMEAGNHFKNGASSKSLTSRGNFFKYFGIIALAVVITVIVSSSVVTSQIDRWEYKLVSTCDDTYLNATEKKLNSLGREGWELISAATHTCGGINEIVFTLKRRVR